MLDLLRQLNEGMSAGDPDPEGKTDFIAYADDLAVWPTGTGPTKALARVQHMTSVVSAWAGKNGIKISQKTSALWLRLPKPTTSCTDPARDVFPHRRSA